MKKAGRHLHEVLRSPPPAAQVPGRNRFGFNPWIPADGDFIHVRKGKPRDTQALLDGTYREDSALLDPVKSFLGNRNYHAAVVDHASRTDMHVVANAKNLHSCSLPVPPFTATRAAPSPAGVLMA